MNFYLPGYVKRGFSASTLQRAGTSLKGHFTDTNDQVIDAYIKVRPDVIEALGKLARGGSRMDVRANAARAVGILRGRAAVPDLLEALRSKDTDVIYESLNALQKIHDESAATGLGFLLRDPEPEGADHGDRNHGPAAEQCGHARSDRRVEQVEGQEGAAGRADCHRHAARQRNRELYARYMRDKDDRLRAAAAEGYARLKNPADLPMLRKAWDEEKKTEPRLSRGVRHGDARAVTSSPNSARCSTW